MIAGGTEKPSML